MDNLGLTAVNLASYLFIQEGLTITT